MNPGIGGYRLRTHKHASPRVRPVVAQITGIIIMKDIYRRESALRNQHFRPRFCLHFWSLVVHDILPDISPRRITPLDY